MADHVEGSEGWAKAQLAGDRPASAPKGISEADIKAKVAAGLTRAQAIEVLGNQAAHDAALEKESSGKGAKAGAKKNPEEGKKSESKKQEDEKPADEGTKTAKADK